MLKCAIEKVIHRAYHVAFYPYVVILLNGFNVYFIKEQNAGGIYYIYLLGFLEDVVGFQHYFIQKEVLTTTFHVAFLAFSLTNVILVNLF